MSSFEQLCYFMAIFATVGWVMCLLTGEIKATLGANLIFFTLVSIMLGMGYFIHLKTIEFDIEYNKCQVKCNPYKASVTKDDKCMCDTTKVIRE